MHWTLRHPKRCSEMADLLLALTQLGDMIGRSCRLGTEAINLLLQFSIVSSQGVGGLVRRFFRQNIIAVRKTRLASWSSSSDQVVMVLCCPSFRYRTADRIVRVTLILGPVADNDPMLAI